MSEEKGRILKESFQNNISVPQSLFKLSGLHERGKKLSTVGESNTLSSNVKSRRGNSYKAHICLMENINR